MSKQSSNADETMWQTFNAFHYLCDTHRYQKLLARADLVKKVRDLPGDIVDCGTFKGISTIQFAHFLKTYRPTGAGRVISFDTFEAHFPRVRPDEAAAAADHMSELYDQSAYDNLREALPRLGLDDVVTLVRGDIGDTLPKFLAERPGFRISLLHCDLDVYAATLDVLKMAWPRLVRGGIIVFDQYAVDKWGESDAVDQFLSTLDDAPRVTMVPDTPTPTAYLVKA